jgi:hypothetical protein
MELEKVYLVTLWSGGRAAKQWQTKTKPEPLRQGTGVTFTDMESRLGVEVIGHISVEEYEQGAELPEQIAPQGFDENEAETF